MDELLLVLMMIAGFFAVFLMLQQATRRKFCALCAAVMLSWLILLLLYWRDVFAGQLLIALLMGGSIVGIYYVLEKKVTERLTLFRLPFLLTLIITGFSLLKGLSGIITGISFVIMVWIVFISIYIFRQNPRLQKITKKIMECCKKW